MTPSDFRAARDQLGLTQAQLAAALDVSKRTVEALEDGSNTRRVYALAVQQLVANMQNPATG